MTIAYPPEVLRAISELRPELLPAAKRGEDIRHALIEGSWVPNEIGIRLCALDEFAELERHFKVAEKIARLQQECARIADGRKRA